MEKHLRQRAQVAKHASRDWGKWWKWWKWVPDLYNRRWKKLAKQCSLIGVFYHWVPSDAHDAESVLVRIATEFSSVLAFLLSLFFMFHNVSSTWQLRYKGAVSPKDLENQPQLDSIPGERQWHFPYTWGVSGLHYVACSGKDVPFVFPLRARLESGPLECVNALLASFLGRRPLILKPQSAKWLDITKYESNYN